MRELRTKEDFDYYVKADLYRYGGDTSKEAFRKAFKHIPGFKFCYYMRKCAYLSKAPVYTRPLFYIANAKYNRLKFRFGFDIEYSTAIGPGLHISHWGGIVINPKAVIGKNCNISHQITVGMDSKEGEDSVPTIGDNVYIAPGSKIFGRISVGSDSAVGANSVVTRDVPCSVTVAGSPAAVVSENDSSGYVKNKFLE